MLKILHNFILLFHCIACCPVGVANSSLLAQTKMQMSKKEVDLQHWEVLVLRYLSLLYLTLGI